MIRTRRISVKVEHTELTISVTETSAQGRQTSMATVPGELAPPKTCPECGARWLPNLQEAVRDFSLTAAQLKAAADSGRLHLCCSPDNEILICERSIQQMKENF